VAANPETASGVGAAPDAAPAPADASSLLTVALRDLALVSAALAIWAGADAWFLLTRAGIGAFVSTLAGLFAGAFVGAQLHEWGHFAGARLGGGTAPIAPAGKLVPLFNFDFARSDEKAFRWMSVGGNLAHWAIVAVLFAVMPWTTPAQVALPCGAFGFAVFASTIEFPVIRRAYEGMSGPEALSTIPVGGIQRSARIGIAAALALFLLLLAASRSR